MGKDELEIFAASCEKIDYLPTRTAKVNEVSLKMKVDLAGGAK